MHPDDYFLDTTSIPMQTSELFTSLQSKLDRQDLCYELLKKKSKALDNYVRSCLARLTQIHQMHAKPIWMGKSDDLMMNDVLENCSNDISRLKNEYDLPGFLDIKDSELDQVYHLDFYKYHSSLFQITLQNLCFWLLIYHWLKYGDLMPYEQVQSLIGIPVETTLRSRDTSSSRVEPSFFIPLEDYLHGIISLVTELSRYSVTRVIQGDFETPMVITQFCSDLVYSNGFQQLDLKNDSLRRRSDGLKYEIKKMEEVVYNIKLRRLGSGPK